MSKMLNALRELRSKGVDFSHQPEPKPTPEMKSEADPDSESTNTTGHVTDSTSDHAGPSVSDIESLVTSENEIDSTWHEPVVSFVDESLGIEVREYQAWRQIVGNETATAEGLVDTDASRAVTVGDTSSDAGGNNDRAATLDEGNIEDQPIRPPEWESSIKHSSSPELRDQSSAQQDSLGSVTNEREQATHEIGVPSSPLSLTDSAEESHPEARTTVRESAQIQEDVRQDRLAWPDDNHASEPDDKHADKVDGHDRQSAWGDDSQDDAEQNRLVREYRRLFGDDTPEDADDRADIPAPEPRELDASETATTISAGNPERPRDEVIGNDEVEPTAPISSAECLLEADDDSVEDKQSDDNDAIVECQGGEAEPIQKRWHIRQESTEHDEPSGESTKDNALLSDQDVSSTTVRSIDLELNRLIGLVTEPPADEDSADELDVSVSDQASHNSELDPTAGEPALTDSSIESLADTLNPTEDERALPLPATETPIAEDVWPVRSRVDIEDSGSSTSDYIDAEPSREESEGESGRGENLQSDTDESAEDPPTSDEPNQHDQVVADDEAADAIHTGVAEPQFEDFTSPEATIQADVEADNEPPKFQFAQQLVQVPQYERSADEFIATELGKHESMDATDSWNEASEAKESDTERASSDGTEDDPADATFDSDGDSNRPGGGATFGEVASQFGQAAITMAAAGDVRQQTELERAVQSDLQNTEIRQQFTQLAKNILANVEETRSPVLFFSAVDSPDDATATILRLASIFVDYEVGRVLLVDGTAHDRKLTQQLELLDELGLAEACDADLPWRESLVSGEHPCLSILAGGQFQPLKQTPTYITPLVEDWRQDYAFTFIYGGSMDCPLSESLALSSDATYVLVRLGTSRRSTAEETVARLRSFESYSGSIVFES